LAVMLAHLALLNYIGVKTGKNVSNFFTCVKVGFLCFFVLAGLLALIIRPEIRVPLSVPVVSTKSWFDAILLLIYAYGGFEGALFVGGESTNPKRDTPIALLLALGIVCVIYTAVQFVTLATLPVAAASVRPLSDAAQRFLGPAGATAIALAALISAYGYLSANLLHSPRITFAMAEHGELPPFLAAIHPRYRTPYISIVVYAAAVFAFAALGNFTWNAMPRGFRAWRFMGPWPPRFPFSGAAAMAKHNFFSPFLTYSRASLLRFHCSCFCKWGVMIFM
jgi:basic amino acid/polyamine antiporter, APA family